MTDLNLSLTDFDKSLITEAPEPPELKPFSVWSEENQLTEADPQSYVQYSDYIREGYLEQGAYTPSVEGEISGSLNSKLADLGVVDEEAIQALTATKEPSFEEKFEYVRAALNSDDEDWMTLTEYKAGEKVVAAGGTVQPYQDKVSGLKLKSEEVVNRRFDEVKRNLVESNQIPLAYVTNETGERELLVGDAAENMTVNQAIKASKIGGVSFKDGLVAQKLLSPVAGLDVKLYKFKQIAEISEGIAELAQQDASVAEHVTGHTRQIARKDQSAWDSLSQSVTRGISDLLTFVGVESEESNAKKKRIYTASRQSFDDTIEYITEKLNGSGANYSPDDVRAAYESHVVNEGARTGAFKLHQDPSEAGKNLYKTALGPVLNPAVFAREEDMVNTLAAHPELTAQQKKLFLDNRVQVLKQNFASYSKLLSESAVGDDWAKALVSGRQAGRDDLDIFDEFVAKDENFNEYLDSAKGIAYSVWDSVASLLYIAPAVMGADWAKDGLANAAQRQSDRREVAQIFGEQYGLFQDVTESVAPLIVDVAATAALASVSGGAAGAGYLAVRSVAKGGAQLTAKGLGKALTSNVLRASSKEGYKEVAEKAAKDLIRESVETGGRAGTIEAIEAFNKAASSKFNLGVATFVPAATRSGAMSYGSLYNQLRKDPNLTEEEAHDRALGFALTSGAITGVITSGFSLIGRGGVEDALLKGMTFRESKKLFQAMGNTGGITNETVKKTMTKVMNDSIKKYGSATLGKKIVKNVVDEAFEEGVDQLVNSFVEDVALNQDTPMLERMKQVWHAAQVGGILGGGVPAIQAGARFAGVTPMDQLEQRIRVMNDFAEQVSSELEGTGSPLAAAQVREIMMTRARGRGAAAPEPAPAPALPSEMSSTVTEETILKKENAKRSQEIAQEVSKLDDESTLPENAEEREAEVALREQRRIELEQESMALSQEEQNLTVAAQSPTTPDFALTDQQVDPEVFLQSLNESSPLDVEIAFENIRNQQNINFNNSEDTTVLKIEGITQLNSEADKASKKRKSWADVYRKLGLNKAAERIENGFKMGEKALIDLYYKGLRTAEDGTYSYSKDAGKVTGVATDTTRVTPEGGWHYRIVKKWKSAKIVTRISMNVGFSPELIAKMDAFLGKTDAGYYKTPDAGVEWSERHDPITVYLTRPLTKSELAELQSIASPNLRTDSGSLNDLSGKKIFDGIFQETSPQQNEMQALIDRAKKVDAELGRAVELDFQQHESSKLKTSAGRMIAVLKAIKDYESGQSPAQVNADIANAQSAQVETPTAFDYGRKSPRKIKDYAGGPSIDFTQEQTNAESVGVSLQGESRTNISSTNSNSRGFDPSESKRYSSRPSSGTLRFDDPPFSGPKAEEKANKLIDFAISHGFPLNLDPNVSYGLPMPSESSRQSLSEFVASAVYTAYPKLAPPKNAKLDTSKRPERTYFDPVSGKTVRQPVKFFVDDSGNGIFDNDPISIIEILKSGRIVKVPRSFNRANLNPAIRIKDGRVTDVVGPTADGRLLESKLGNARDVSSIEPNNARAAALASIPFKPATLPDGVADFDPENGGPVEGEFFGSTTDIKNRINRFALELEKTGDETTRPVKARFETLSGELDLEFRAAALESAKQEFLFNAQLFSLREKLLSNPATIIDEVVAQTGSKNVEQAAQKLLPFVKVESNINLTSETILGLFVEQKLQNNPDFANNATTTFDTLLRKATDRFKLQQDDANSLREQRAVSTLPFDVAPAEFRNAKVSGWIANFGRNPDGELASPQDISDAVSGAIDTAIGAVNTSPDLRREVNKIILDEVLNDPTPEMKGMVENASAEDVFGLFTSWMSSGNGDTRPSVNKLVDAIEDEALSDSGTDFLNALLLVNFATRSDGASYENSDAVSAYQALFTDAVGTQISIDEARNTMIALTKAVRTHLSRSNISAAERATIKAENEADIERLGLESGNPDSVIKALKEVAKNSDNPSHKVVADLLLRDTDLIKGVKFVLGETTADIAGKYIKGNDGSHTVFINVTSGNGRGLVNTLLEEYVHAFISDTISSTEAQRGSVRGTKTRINALSTVLSNARTAYAKQKKESGPVPSLENALVDLNEFTAQFLLSEEVQKHVRDLKPAPNRSSFLSRFLTNLAMLFPNVGSGDASKIAESLGDVIDVGRNTRNTTTTNAKALGGQIGNAVTLSSSPVAQTESRMERAEALREMQRETEQARLEAKRQKDVEDAERFLEGVPEADRPKVRELYNYIRGLVPVGMDIKLTTESGGSAAFVSSDSSAIFINLPVMLRQTGDVSDIAGRAIAGSIINEELTHTASFNALTAEEVQNYINSLSDSDFVDIAKEYLVGNEGRLATTLASLQSSDPQVVADAKYQLAEEKLRMHLQKVTRGFTTEDDTQFWKSKPSLLRILNRYFRGIINRWVANRKKIGPAADVALNKLIIEMRAIEVGFVRQPTKMAFNPENPMEAFRMFGTVNQDFVGLASAPVEDAEYMAAVESGDVETQQRMVNEAAKAAPTLKRLDATQFSDILAPKEQKGRRLKGGMRDTAGNYVTSEGVEVTISPETSLLYINGEQYAGDVEIEFIGIPEQDQRGKGYASAELNRIIREADRRDMSLSLSVDAFGATDAGADIGLGDARLKELYQRKGFIFDGSLGYRPRISENRANILPKNNTVQQEEVNDIESILNEALESGPSRSISDPDSLFELAQFEPQSIPLGYLEVGGELYFYDGNSRPSLVENVKIELEGGFGEKLEYSLSLKDLGKDLEREYESSYNLDPITRDANGNVIPLSQRFDESKSSILYSAPVAGATTPAEIPPEIASASDPIVKHIYVKEDGKFYEKIKNGYIKIQQSLDQFEGMAVMLHQPDGAMAGTLEVEGDKVVDGKGGVYYPVMFGDQGYFWASTKDAAVNMAENLNKISKRNNGTILMALTSAPIEKMFSSTTMATGAVNLFATLAKNPKKYGITEAVVNRAIVNASKERLVLKKKDKDTGVETTTIKEFSRKLKLKDGLAKNIEEMKKNLLPEESVFPQRGSFVAQIASAIADSMKLPTAEVQKKFNPKEKAAFDKKKNQALNIANLLAGDKNLYNKSLIPTGNLKMASVMQGMADLFAEPLVKTFQQFQQKSKTASGRVYAVLSMKGEVEAVETDFHDSYPYSIRSTSGETPVVHVLSESNLWKDVVYSAKKPNPKKAADPYDGNTDPIKKSEEDSIFPPSVGVSQRELIFRKADEGVETVKLPLYSAPTAAAAAAAPSGQQTGSNIDFSAVVDLLEIPVYETETGKPQNFIMKFLNNVFAGELPEAFRRLIQNRDAYKRLTEANVVAYKQEMDKLIKETYGGYENAPMEMIALAQGHYTGNMVTDEVLDAIEKDYDDAHADAENKRKAGEITDEQADSLKGLAHNVRTEATDKAYEDARKSREADRDTALRDLAKDSPELAAHIIDIRQRLIIPLQKKLVDSGLDKNIGAKISKTGGIYITRSYRMFTDSSYLQKVREDPDYQDVRDAAMEFFEDQYIKNKAKELFDGGMDESRAKVEARILLERENQSSPHGSYAQGSLNTFLMQYEEGGRDSTTTTPKGYKMIEDNLRRRKELPEAIRNLLGEIGSESGIDLILRTYSTVATIASQQAFLNQMVKYGKDTGVMVTVKEKLATAESRAKYANFDAARSGAPSKNDPLSGMQVDRKFKELLDVALMDSLSMGYADTAEKAVKGAVGLAANLSGKAMAAKTLGSIGFYLRNGIGNLLFGTSQGFFRYDKMVSEMLKGTYDLRPFKDGEIDPELNELIGLNIKGDELRAGVLKDLLNGKVTPDGIRKQIEDLGEKTKLNKVTKGLAIIEKKAQDLSAALDAAYKIVYYNHELAILMEAKAADTSTVKDGKVGVNNLAAMSDTQIKRLAARKVVMTSQAYSQAPPAVAAYTKSGLGLLFAPFIRFKMEVPRIMINTFKLASEEIASGNPVLVRRGRFRKYSMIGTLGVLSSALPMALAALSGIGDEEDEAMRASIPDYLRGHTFFYFRWNGELKSVDLTYVNPYSLLVDPFLRGYENIRRGEFTEAGAAIALGLVRDQYLDDQILAGAVSEARRNLNPSTGKPIWNKGADGPMEAGSKILGHIAKEAYAPRLGKDFFEGWATGSLKGMTLEIMDGAMPFRIHDVDLQKQYSRYLLDLNNRFNNVKSGLNAVKRNVPMSDGDVADIIDENIEDRRLLNYELMRINKGFASLGLTDTDLLKGMKDKKLGRDRVALLSKGYMDRPSFKYIIESLLDPRTDEYGRARAQQIYDHASKINRYIPVRPITESE